MSNWPNPGVYTNISPDDYFSLKEIDGKLVRSNSMLKVFDRDPKEFRSGYEVTVSDSMRRGSIIDCLLTQQHRFERDFIISPYHDFKSKEAQQWRDSQTQTIVKPSEFEEAERHVHAIHSDPRWKEMTAGNCQFQVGIRADIEGLPWKCMIDILPDENGPYGDAIIDIKRLSQTETLDDVLRTCRKFEYNRQLGLYRGLARIQGLNRKRAFLFIIPQSGTAAICVLQLGEQMLANGAHAIMRINDRLIECEQTGIWPGRFDGIKQIEQADETWSWTEVEAPLEEAGNLEPLNA